MNDLSWAWPTPLLHRPLPNANQRNEAILHALERRRIQEAPDRSLPYISGDDLHLQTGSSALRELFQLIGRAIYDVAASANEDAWQGLDRKRISVHIVGAWCQITNGYRRHDIHNHGNCSWSGVTYLDVDPDPQRAAHPVLGAENGVTRLYGPTLPRLGGAAMDLGAAWMQDAHLDVIPQPGAVVVWPSFLLHQQLPYDGTRDRVVISFNAQIHGPNNETRPYGM